MSQESLKTVARCSACSATSKRSGRSGRKASARDTSRNRRFELFAKRGSSVDDLSGINHTATFKGTRKASLRSSGKRAGGKRTRFEAQDPSANTTLTAGA